MTKLKLSRRTLRIIAIVAMLIDHVAYLFVHKPFYVYAAMRCVGRLTAPIMCFFIAEGFKRTSSKEKYWARLFVFAVLSQVPYTLAFEGKALLLTEQSMIFTLLIGLSAIWAFDSIKNKRIGLAAVALCAAMTASSDWYVIAVIWIFVFYYFDDMVKKIAAFAVSTAGFLVYVYFDQAARNVDIKYFFLQFAIFLVMPLIIAYDGKEQKTGKLEKYFFYAFYPAHLLVLWAIKALR